MIGFFKESVSCLPSANLVTHTLPLSPLREGPISVPPSVADGVSNPRSTPPQDITDMEGVPDLLLPPVEKLSPKPTNNKPPRSLYPPLHAFENDSDLQPADEATLTGRGCSL